ncbi:unnamed protein product [Peniophora sp. CBMAI 1063]|nr:unnamed protein product [Peniophora sp. CBMAI 1063]
MVLVLYVGQVEHTARKAPPAGTDLAQSIPVYKDKATYRYSSAFQVYLVLISSFALYSKSLDMKSIAALASFVVLATAVSADRTFTVKNQCSYTIWPGLFTQPGGAVPSQPTGWEMASGATTTFTVPDNWTAGRIWPRTECDFATNPGPTSCATGGCNRGLECTPVTGSGVPPATLAEFTLSSSSTDFYDVSIVDGFNVPLEITPSSSGCGTTTCSANLNPDCPAILQVKDASGAIVGCNSDCQVTHDSAACCTPPHSTPATCPSSGVPYYDYFKGQCPDAYVYAYDDASATFTCPGSDAAGYTITFCP